jgi:GT2 family glycosyltransferase
MFSTKLVQPFYLEDVEWCFRARVAGYRAYYVPEHRATHFYKRDSVKKINKLSFVHMANIFIFFRLHWLDMLLGRHRRTAPLVLSPTQG